MSHRDIEKNVKCSGYFTLFESILSQNFNGINYAIVFPHNLKIVQHSEILKQVGEE